MTSLNTQMRTRGAGDISLRPFPCGASRVSTPACSHAGVRLSGFYRVVSSLCLTPPLTRRGVSSFRRFLTEYRPAALQLSLTRDGRNRMDKSLSGQNRAGIGFQTTENLSSSLAGEGCCSAASQLIQICRALLCVLRRTDRQGLSVLLSASYSAPLAGFAFQPLDYVLHYVIQPLNFTTSIRVPHYGSQRSGEENADGKTVFGELKNVLRGNERTCVGDRGLRGTKSKPQAAYCGVC